MGIAEAKQLLGKRFLMRSRKLRLAPYMLPLPPPLLIDNVRVLNALNLQFEKPKSEKVEERALKRQKPTSSPP